VDILSLDWEVMVLGAGSRRCGCFLRLMRAPLPSLRSRRRAWAAGAYKKAFGVVEKGDDVCCVRVSFFRGIPYPAPGPHGLCAGGPVCLLVMVSWTA